MPMCRRTQDRIVDDAQLAAARAEINRLRETISGAMMIKMAAELIDPIIIDAQVRAVQVYVKELQRQIEDFERRMK